MAVLGILCVVLVVLRVTGVNPFKRAYSENAGEDIEAVKPDIDVELLTENPYSRPGTATDQITGIVVHYTANPGSTAMDNRNYFEGLKDSHITKASSNFVVGLDGEIVQCVPTWEVAVCCLTPGIMIRYRLSAVILDDTGKSMMRHIALWFSSLCVVMFEI